MRLSKPSLILSPMFLMVMSAGIVHSALAAPTPEQTEFFEKKIRPVLADRCYECHSATSKKLKGGLRVDSLGGMLLGGDSGPAIVAGEPDKSKLIEAIGYQNVDLQMPPKSKLESQQVADFKEWIKMGAPWPGETGTVVVENKKKFDLEKRKQEQWCWQPIHAQAPPAVKNQKWPLNPIDNFVLAKLEAKDIAPAPEADKRALIRRATFDLTGLPPTPEEIDAFLNDHSAEAYPRLVDRLLASPQFGERWARHWLDLVRYAETMGHEFDFPIYNAWRYRDYVIRAFNDDLPYDQFVLEQVAGDMLPNPRRNPTEGYNESMIGTGFYWLLQQKQAPVDVKQEQSELIDNQIDVLSKTFLGLTVACARCHDHKFDAISSKDYYSLYGIMESSRFRQASIDSPEKVGAKVRELNTLKHEIHDDLGKLWVNHVLPVDKYLLAAREVIVGDGQTNHVASESTDVVFEDFEKPTFEGWTVTGDAFAAGPQTQKSIADYQGDVGAVGKGFVNSHNGRKGDKNVSSDELTGKMVSKNFKIQHRYIHFLIGGGSHQDKTCINLVIDGQPVLSKTGVNLNRMHPASFDASQFMGREAHLEIVDDEKGPWGNIGIDHIVFSNRATVFGANNQPLPPGLSSEVVARKYNLDAGLLDRWVVALQNDEVRQVYHPLMVWRTLSQPDPSGRDVRFDLRWDSLLRVMQRQATASQRPAHGNAHDLPNWRTWTSDDVAFSDGPTRVGDFVLGSSAATPVANFTQANWAHSATLSRELQGTLRSPTFTIDRNCLHVRASGKSARINVVIDGFTLIRAPIYGELKINVNQEMPRWYKVDLKMWKGHRAYLEFADISVPDPADAGEASNAAKDGYLAVQEASLSDDYDAPRNQSSPDALALLGEEDVDTIEILAQRYQSAFAGALKAWADNKLDGPAAAAQCALLDWMVRQQLLPMPENKVDETVAVLFKKFQSTEAALAEPMRVPAMGEGSPVDEKVFVRGSYKTPGELAPRRFLEAIAGDKQPAMDLDSGRLELARRMIDSSDPLLARVMVNRTWHHLFGVGIVPSVDNFGVLGQPPTHPELLDWLAARYRQDGWSTKKMVRLMMLSRAYQMSSLPTDAVAEAKDPTDALLHRMRVRRLEGEAIRDAILAVAGRLDKKMYGPSVAVYLTPFMEGRGRPGKSGPVDGEGRRSIYVETRRNFLSPMMLAYDAPIPYTTVGRRTVSNVPAQALILMNDPFVVQQTQLWAKHLLAEKNEDTAQRIHRIYTAAFGRLPSESEIAAGVAFIEEQTRNYNLSPEDKAGSEKVWADFCHVVLNVKEFVFIN